jgi:prevent-host-death family protein
MYMQMYILNMSTKYSVAEARTNLPKILDEVELGGEVELTRRGKRVAVVMSVEEYERLSGGYRDFAEAYEAHRQKYEGLERSVLEDARDRSLGRTVQL